MSMAFDVSGNGAVVGTATGADGQEAFVWDAKNGMRALKSVLGPAAASWRLLEATGITPDGRTVIGNGTNPDGKPEGFVARLP